MSNETGNAPDKEISIELTIGGRTYPLRVLEADEKRLRRAEKAIEERLKHWQQISGTRDAQDRLAMALLTGWLELLKENDARNMSLQTLDKKLKRLGETLGTREG